MSDGKTNESLGNNYKLAADLGIKCLYRRRTAHSRSN